MGFLDNFEVIESNDSFLSGFDIVDESEDIGSVSSKYESRGDASAISTGIGDIGGKSYGTYQLSSNTGTLKDYLSKSKYKDEFSNTSVGSPVFDRKWREKSTDPEFINEQKQYIVDTHYNPVKSHISKNYGLDISQSKPIQELVFSTSVQFGSGNAKKVIDEALKNVDEYNERDIIDAITNEKMNTNKWFKNSPEATKMSVADRFEKERQDLYSLIDQYEEEPTITSFEELNTRPQEEESSTLSNLTRSGVAGLAGATSMFYSLPAGVAGTWLAGQNTVNKGINYLFGNKIFSEDTPVPDFLLNNNLVQIPKKVQEEQSAAAKESFGDKRLIDLVKDKNIGKTAEWLGQFVLEQAPNSVVTGTMIANNIPKITTLALMGLSTSGQKLSETKDKVDSGEISNLQAQLDAGLNGLFEAGFEATGEYKVLEGLTNALKGVGTDVAKKTSGFIQKAIKGFFKGASQEVPSEVVTQITQDLTDKITGVNPDLTTGDILNNVFEAAAGTTFMGGAPGALTETISGGATQTQDDTQPAEQLQEEQTQEVTPRSPEYFNTGSPEAFVERYNATPSDARGWLMDKLTSDEQNEVKKLLNAPNRPVEEVSTQEPTPTMPTPTEAVEQAPMEELERTAAETIQQEEVPVAQEAQEGTIESTSPPTPPVTTQEAVSEPTEAPMAVTEEIKPKVRTVIPKSKEKVSDQKEKERIRSSEQKRETAVERKPVKESGSKKTGAGGVLQTSKDVKKYSTKELIDLQKSKGRNGSKVVKTIVSEAGIKVPSKNIWQSHVLEYAKKHGTEEDIDNALKLFEDKGKSVSKGVKTKQVERLEKTGDTRPEYRQTESKVLKEIINEGIVEYNKDKHDFIISDFKDNKPIYTNKQYSNAIDIQTINGKQYITIKETTKGDKSFSGIDILQDIEAASAGKRGGSVSSYNEQFKTKDDEKLDEQTIEEMSPEEKQFESRHDVVKDELTAEQEFEDDEVKSATLKARQLLEQRFEKGTPEYENGLRAIKAMEQDYGLADYDEDLSDVRYAKEGLRDLVSPKGEIEIDEIRPSDKAKGKEIAKSLGLRFNGIQPGMSRGGKRVTDAIFMFTDDASTGSTLPLPISSNINDVRAKLKSSRERFLREDAEFKFKEVLKPFKNLKSIPEIVISNKIPDGNILGKSDYGAVYTDRTTGNISIYLNEKIAPKDILPTLIHEMWGHLGAEKVLSEIDVELAQYVLDLYTKDYDSEFSDKLRSIYGKNESVLFSEWVAARMEQAQYKYFDKNGKFDSKIYEQDKSILRKVYDKIKEFVGEVFKRWFGTPATKNDIDEAMFAVAQKFSEVEYTRKKQKTRKSTKEAPKKKRKVKSRKEKYKTYAEDRLRLTLSEDVGDLQLRYFDFATKHFYGDRAESYRRQIFDLLDKVEEIGDKYHKKLNTIIDEFADWEKAESVFKSFKKFTRKYKSALSKNYSGKSDSAKLINSVKDSIKNIEEQYADYVEYQSLKRLRDRISVERPERSIKGDDKRKPIKKAYEEALNEGRIPREIYDTEIRNTDEAIKKGKEFYFAIPSTDYVNLYNKGLIEKEVFYAGEYELSDSGKQALKEKSDLYDINKENKFDAYTIESDINDIRANYKEFISISKTETDEAKDELKQKVKDIKERIESIRVKAVKKDANRILDYIKNADLNTVNLEYLVNALDDFDETGAFTKHIFGQLDKGRNRTYATKHRTIDFMKQELSKIPRNVLLKMDKSFQTGIIGNIKKAKTVKPDVYTIKLNGENVDLSISQKISLYMLSKNPRALRHLIGKNGGFSLTPTSLPIKITESDLLRIQDDMTKYEKIVADMYFKLGEMNKKQGNKVSNKLVGYDIFNEEMYHPILTKRGYYKIQDRSVTNSEQLAQRIVRMSPSALKERTNSDSPIVLEGVFDAFSRVSPMVEKYIGSALPSKSVNSILNSNDFITAMDNKFLHVEYNMLKKLIDKYNGDILTIQGGEESFVRTVQNIFTVATLGYKASTVAIQPTAYYSYLTAMPDIDLTDKAKILTIGHTGAFGKEYKRISKLMYENSPYLRERGGAGDFVVGELRKTAESRERVVGGKRGIEKTLSAEGAMLPMIEADKRTIAMIWKAVEEEFKVKGNDISTQENIKKIANKVSYIVRRTQATSDVLDRPNVMNKLYWRPLTMFTSEPIKKLMMVRRAIRTFKRNPKKSASDLFMIMVFQPAAVEVIRTSILSARGKGDMPEDEKEFLLWFLKRIGINNVAMYPVLGSVIASALSGYDVNMGGVPEQLINNIISLSKSIVNRENKDKINKKLYRFSKMVGAIDFPTLLIDVVKNMLNQ